LKFFEEVTFMKEIKDRREYFGMEEAFASKKYVIEFFQEFVNSQNF
jgi:hypothetical protein